MPSSPTSPPDLTASSSPIPAASAPSADDRGQPSRSRLPCDHQASPEAADPTSTHLQVPAPPKPAPVPDAPPVRFTVTPLGGSRSQLPKVVEGIVRYLQPPPQTTPGPSPGRPGEGRDGPGDYYADSGEEPSFGVGPDDVFPEEFERFLGVEGDLKAEFMSHHRDLYTAQWWLAVQKRVAAGELIDIFPYDQSARLPESERAPATG